MKTELHISRSATQNCTIDHPSAAHGSAAQVELSAREPADRHPTAQGATLDVAETARPAPLAPMLCPQSRVLMTLAHLGANGHSWQMGAPGVAAASLKKAVANLALQKAVAHYTEGDPEWDDALKCIISDDFPTAPVHIVAGQGAKPITEWRLYEATAIQMWFKQSRRSPLTREPMQGNYELRPDYAAQKLCHMRMAEAPSAAESIYPANLSLRLGPTPQPGTGTTAAWAPFNHMRQAGQSAALCALATAISGGIALGAAEITKLSQTDYSAYYGPTSSAKMHWEWSAYGSVAGLAVSSSLVLARYYLDYRRHPSNPAPVTVAEVNHDIV
jgi:hypothetical protein